MTPYLPRLMLLTALALTAAAPVCAAPAASDTASPNEQTAPSTTKDAAAATHKGQSHKGLTHGANTHAPKTHDGKTATAAADGTASAEPPAPPTKAKSGGKADARRPSGAKTAKTQAKESDSAPAEASSEAEVAAPPAHRERSRKSAQNASGKNAPNASGKGLHGAKSSARIAPQDEDPDGARRSSAQEARGEQARRDAATEDRTSGPDARPPRLSVAHLPKIAPLPPPRPDFPDDARLASETARAAAPGEVAPQGVYQQARFEAGAQVEQYAAAPAPQPQNAWPFGSLVAPAQPAPPPPPPQAAEPPAPAQAEAPYDPVPSRKKPDYDARQPPEDVPGFEAAERAGLAEITRKYAQKNGIPLALLHRVIMRESKYSPHLVHRSYYGLMQITPATARSMGYRGSAKGLLDPETNLAYASAYLANAWALSGGNMDRAVQLYASGYYYTAKNKGMLDQMRDANSPPVAPSIAAPPPPPRPGNVFEAMFSGSPR